MSELQQQNAQLSASAKRAEAEVLKSVAALKAVKESRAFSTNQKVALGSVWVDGASRHGSLHVCGGVVVVVCLFVCLSCLPELARAWRLHAYACGVRAL